MSFHRDLPASQCHEAKQIIEALTSDAGKVITPSSTNPGEGVLRFLAPADIDGLSAEQGVQDGRLTALEAATLKAYGGKTINSNATAITLAAAVDPLFNDAGDYVEVTGIYESPDIAPFKNVGSLTNRLEVEVTGLYAIHFWATLQSDVNSNIVAFNFGVNGAVQTDRPVKVRAPNSTDPVSGAAHAYINLTAGQEISLHIAAKLASDVTISNGRVSLELIEVTP